MRNRKNVQGFFHLANKSRASSADPRRLDRRRMDGLWYNVYNLDAYGFVWSIVSMNFFNVGSMEEFKKFENIYMVSDDIIEGEELDC